MTFRTLTVLEHQVACELVACGEVTGYEYAATMDACGATVIDFRTDRLPNRSWIGQTAIDKLALGDKIVIRHNHPACNKANGITLGRSLSAADWALLRDNPGIIEISAHCPDSTIYRGAITSVDKVFAAAHKMFGEAEASASNIINRVVPQPVMPSIDELMTLAEGEVISAGYEPEAILLAAADMLSMHAVNCAMQNLCIAKYDVAGGTEWPTVANRFATEITDAIAAAKNVFITRLPRECSEWSPPP